NGSFCRVGNLRIQVDDQRVFVLVVCFPHAILTLVSQASIVLHILVAAGDLNVVIGDWSVFVNKGVKHIPVRIPVGIRSAQVSLETLVIPGQWVARVGGDPVLQLSKLFEVDIVGQEGRILNTVVA